MKVKIKLKESKISFLVHRFETIAELIIRFIDITNSLIALGKEYTQVEKVRKVF